MKTELLAPAGSVEGMHAAVAAGADAVYMGGTLFGARAYAKNPAEEELKEAIDYVHLHEIVSDCEYIVEEPGTSAAAL